MVKIRFRQDRVVQDCFQGTPHETRFSAGQIVDLPEASANHWISRGIADRVPPAEEPEMSQAEPQTTPEASASEGAHPRLDLPEHQSSEGDTPAGEGAEPEGDDPAAADGAAPAGADDAPAAEQDGANPSQPRRKPGRASGKAGGKA